MNEEVLSYRTELKNAYFYRDTLQYKLPGGMWEFDTIEVLSDGRAAGKPEIKMVCKKSPSKTLKMLHTY